MDSRPAPEPTNAAGVDTNGAEVRRLRELKGLTRTELAERCEITPGYLSHIENGHRRPSAPIFARICDELGVSDRQVLRRERRATGKAAVA